MLQKTARNIVLSDIQILEKGLFDKHSVATITEKKNNTSLENSESMMTRIQQFQQTLKLSIVYSQNATHSHGRKTNRLKT